MIFCTTKSLGFAIPAIAAALVTSAWAQDGSSTEIGAAIFARSCATGYCHGAGGAPGGAPRLSARGFDRAYINGVLARGIPGSSMPSFATTLSRADLAAVAAFVGSLNGISTTASAGLSQSAPARAALKGDAARGAKLFSEAVRGFGRCSTCHQVAELGISVTDPVKKVPSGVAAFKDLATPNVKTAIIDSESMPALLLNDGKQRIVLYDLTSAPPVLRTLEPGTVKVADGSSWRHSSVTGAYDDSELTAILAYLRAAVN